MGLAAVETTTHKPQSRAARMQSLEDVGGIRSLAQDWEASLNSRRISPKTLKSYRAATDQFADYLESVGMTTTVANLRRDNVESFIAFLLEKNSPSTAATRYRGLQQFFNWCEEEGECEASPMARMKPPTFDDKEIPVIPDADIKAVLDTCRGRSFEDRRDEAVIRLFLDCGLRLAELTHLTLEDIDLDNQTVRVQSAHAKRKRERTVRFGYNTERAINRYLRSRARHNHVRNTRVWLGPKGPLTDSGIVQLIRRRCRQAGLDYLIHPHAFRHLWAHKCKEHGISDDTLMYLAGWTSIQMVFRYGRSAQGERARNAARVWSPGESF